jgi:hypothetical protein
MLSAVVVFLGNDEILAHKSSPTKRITSKMKLLQLFDFSPPPNEPANGDEANPPRWPQDGDNTVVVVEAGTDPTELQNMLNDYQDPQEAATFTNPNTKTTETVQTFRPSRHFVGQRTAILFEPGEYECDLQVGYYTQVAGLGATADAVHFKSSATGDSAKMGPYCPAYNKDQPEGPLRDPNGNEYYILGSSLDTFWRSAENFQSSVPGGMLWAVSQAAPLRRVHATGDLLLHDDGAFASGGVLANGIVGGQLIFGSQQQFCARSINMSVDPQGASNTVLGAWSNVFVDCVNPPPSNPGNRQAAVTLDNPSVTVEKPFLVMDTSDPNNKKYKLHVPQPRIRPEGSAALGADLVGTTDNARDFTRVYVAKAKIPDGDSGYVADKDVARKINKALQQGKDVVLSPGIYSLNKPIMIAKPNQVILGIGMATMVAPNDGSPCIQVPSKMEGIRLAGITFEASRIPQNRSKVASFVEWGVQGVTGDQDPGNPENPGLLSDIFARVGGASLDRFISTDVMLRIHSGNVVGDNLWLWRADHVMLGDYELPNFPPLNYHQTTQGEVPVKTGLEVNGDNVTIHGLAVEHTTQHQVIWNGENGNVQFYQCELPYDVDGSFGLQNYLGYNVHPNVSKHQLGGAGVYSNFRDYSVLVQAAIQHPRVFEDAEVGESNPHVTNPFTVHLNNQGRIMTVVTDGEQNGGGPALAEQGPSRFPVPLPTSASS